MNKSTTFDKIITRPASKEYRDNFDSIFRKPCRGISANSTADSLKTNSFEGASPSDKTIAAVMQLLDIAYSK